MIETGLGGPSFWILTALASGRSHGYGILKTVKSLSNDKMNIKVTTLYAALDRLERDGLIRADGDEIVDGRLRSYFALSPAGSDRLAAEIDRMEAQAATARQQLGGAPTAAWGLS